MSSSFYDYIGADMTAEGPGKSKIQYGYTHCPSCHTDLDGGMIPVERRQVFNGVDRYSLATLNDNRQLICPACGVNIDAFLGRT